MMKDSDIKILEAEGWTVECELPLEIRHVETESFATGTAAYYVLDALVNAEERKNMIIEELAQKFVDDMNFVDDTDVISEENNTIDTQLNFGILGTRTPKELISIFYNRFENKGIL
jgi:hypothetical protein